MLKKADVFTVDREEVERIYEAWQKVEPFINKGCDPKHTQTLRQAIHWMRVEAGRE